MNYIFISNKIIKFFAFLLLLWQGSVGNPKEVLRTSQKQLKSSQRPAYNP